MIAFIDTEVDPQTKKVTDYGAVREDGAVLHSHSKADFDTFVSKCDTICGHNIINHDLMYTALRGNPTIIDTLFLSPLLFPNLPYHNLVKDDKLQVDELNNPANDSMKARDLLNDEIAEWNQLSHDRQEIYYQLLHQTQEFEGFFRYVGYSKPSSFIGRILRPQQNCTTLILNEFNNKICSHADFDTLLKQYAIELAYCLSVIGADDIFSITPAWVIRNYPQVVNVMNMLRNKSCGECNYCRQRLDAHNGLKEFFGYDEFRTFDGIPMQQQAVESAIRGESLLTIFPTGGGKSLTFQLPALMEGRNTHGLTVVISPLQSLMKDQVDNLAARGISEAVTINGLLDPIERATAIEQVSDGRANLLYIAPEMLRSKTIEKLLISRNVVRFVIDEAHCFSAWGHDFRVDYLYIGDFIRNLQNKKQLSQPIAVSCFTATAKQKVISDICDYFRAKLGLELKIFAANAERKNLRYSVLHADTPEEKYNLLRSLIIGHNCPTIVYVSRTKITRELAQHLKSDGIQALPFNGKMEAAEKVENQNAFMSGDAQVIVATSAFGMGVDKKDVGLVVHYNISDSLENYVQEAGRAGRDPEMQAECFVLYDDSDLDKHFILLNQTKLSISEIQQVWKAIKELTVKRDYVSCSPLDIARQAGWGEEIDDIETRVKAAIAALEDAGFIQRGSNSPHIFATGIAVKNMDEARRKLTLSPLFDDQSREDAVRIIKSLISARATAEGRGAEAESRVDYLADILGLNKASVIRNINLMRQEGLLADSRDMQAWISKSTSQRNLEIILKLERFLLQRFGEEAQRMNYKELNEEAQKSGLTYSNIKRLRLLLHFLSLKGYIYKQEVYKDNVEIRLQASQEVTMARFERRMEICRFIIDTLNVSRDPTKDMTLVNFSVVELLKQFIASQQETMFAEKEKPDIADIEEALLYLTKTELMKIEGGFIVIYNTMQIGRIADRRARYGKEQYRLLDEFYKQRIRQIHIVGEYANLMVRDYNAALRFVNDYFTMDFRKFINHYFKDERRAQIDLNITPAKYDKLFGELSNRQCEIIDDNQSKYIVVAAGPGSGKTRVLVHKLASLLLLEDVKHEQLLMLTFSRAAATEFKKRLIDLVGNVAHYVEIKTFHSYSFDLIGKQGSLDEAKDVVRHAAEMIEKGEVEPSKMAKSVLVIDEAQDMGQDDFRLVQALMRQNEEMRVIAVGDDDQNIYAFRGSDSRYMQSLVSQEGAKLYEMTDNYRSAKAIVDCANRFVQRIPGRMKHATIQSATGEEGRVMTLKSLHNTEIKVQGGTAILTRTNEETMQVAYELEQRGLHVTVIQSMDNDFCFGNLAEVRYFIKQIGKDDEVTISKEKWQEAKKRTLKTYASSTCLDVMRRFFADFEAINRVYYRSDLREFIIESDIEDFIASDDKSVFVSTIHKAKGREFETVYLMSSVPDGRQVEDMRAYYVGLTRAKRNLYLVTNPPTEYSSISIALNMHDVKLDHFKGRKETVLCLRSGDSIQYKDDYLYNQQGISVAALSATGKNKIKVWTDKGYEVTSAKVSYTLAWRPKDSETEYAVCLANLVLSKKEEIDD